MAPVRKSRFGSNGTQIFSIGLTDVVARGEFCTSTKTIHSKNRIGRAARFQGSAHFAALQERQLIHMDDEALLSWLYADCHFVFQSDCHDAGDERCLTHGSASARLALV